MKTLVPVLTALVLAACSSAPSNRSTTSVPPARPESPSAADGARDTRLQALLDQGYHHYARGDYTRALQNFDMVFLLDPQLPETWARYLLFYCHLAQANYGSALITAEELLKIDPHQPLAYVQVGLAQLWRGNAGGALESLHRALEFESHPPRTHFYSALAHERLGNTKAREKSLGDAVAEYEQILQRNPKDFTANYELAALLLFANREPERAARHVAAAKESVLQSNDEELPPDRRLFADYYVPLLEGILLYRKQDPRGSLKALTDALANAPSGARADLAELYHYLGLDHLALGEKDNARALLKKQLELDPMGPHASGARALLRR